MFHVYARHHGNGQRTQTECGTLDEALLHLREIIASEMEDPEGPLYWEYGVNFDPSLAAGMRPPQYHFPKVHEKVRVVYPKKRRPASIFSRRRVAEAERVMQLGEERAQRPPDE